MIHSPNMETLINWLFCYEVKEKIVVGETPHCFGLFGTHDYGCPKEWTFIRGTIKSKNP